jgi:hypothetical protein
MRTPNKNTHLKTAINQPISQSLQASILPNTKVLPKRKSPFPQ